MDFSYERRGRASPTNAVHDHSIVLSRELRAMQLLTAMGFSAPRSRAALHHCACDVSRAVVLMLRKT